MMDTKKGMGRRVEMAKREEYALAFGIAAFCLPFLFVIAFFFETAPYEPYDFIIFVASLLGGSFFGSVLGIISLLLHRRNKSKKVYILSMFPIFIFLIVIILLFIFPDNGP